MARPRIETPTALHIVGFGPDLDSAARDAVEQGVVYLVEDREMDEEDAYMLLSLVGDLVVGTSPRPIMGVRLVVPNLVLAQLPRALTGCPACLRCALATPLLQLGAAGRGADGERVVNRSGVRGGLFSFLSPCVLPLFPSYLSFITGMSVDQLQSATGDDRGRGWILAHSLAFVAGFSMVFVGMGASFSALGQLLFDYRERFRLVGGLLIIVSDSTSPGCSGSASSAATSSSSSARSQRGSSGRGWSA